MTHFMNNSEHRWGERVRVNIPVQVASRTLAGIDGRLKNVSLSGGLIRADFDLLLHSIIEVSIKLPPPSQREAIIKAQVTRKLKEDYVGVEWCEFAPCVVKDLLRSASIRAPLG